MTDQNSPKDTIRPSHKGGSGSLREQVISDLEKKGVFDPDDELIAEIIEKIAPNKGIPPSKSR